MAATADRLLRRASTAGLVVGAAVAGVCVALLTQPARAQDADVPAAEEKAPEDKSLNKSCGGLPITSTVVNTVRGLFGRSSRSVLARIRPGPYCASAQALGSERDLSNRRAVRAGLVHLPAFTDYANAVLERIKIATKLTDVPGSVYVSADFDFNVDTTADGNIYLSIGALRTLESEDALVALLAHELSHVVLGHHESDLFVTLQKQLQMVGAAVAGIRRTIEGYERTGNTKAGLTPRDTQQLQRLQLIIAVSDGILHPSWNRRQEQEADRLAADLAQQLGYSYSSGMRAVLDYLQASEEQRNTEAAEQRQQLQEASQGDLGKQLGADLKRLFDELGRKHDDASVRKKALDTYVEQTYGETAPTGSRPNEFRKIKDSAQVKVVLEGYEAASKADRMLLKGEARAALTEADRVAGRRGTVADRAYPLLVLSRALRRSGQTATANTMLARSTTATDPVFQAHFEHASQLARDGKRDAAFSAIERSFEAFQKAPNVYPELIRFYTDFGQKDRAQKLLSECVISLPSIRETCAQQAKGG